MATLGSVFLGFLVLGLLTLVTTVTPGVVNPKGESRIIGGESAAEGQFPYEVFLENDTTFLCSGIIVSDDTILTSSQCVKAYKAETMTVVAGTVWTTRGDPRVVKKVKSFKILDTSNCKLATLKLESALEFNTTVYRIKMREDAAANGTKCLVLGRGSTNANLILPSAILKFVEVFIVDKAQCSTLRGESINDGSICAGHPEGGKDVCYYDAGSPLVCDGLLTGVTSYGYECGNTGKPSVYDDITTCRSLIESEINGVGTTAGRTTWHLLCASLAVLVATFKAHAFIL